MLTVPSSPFMMQARAAAASQIAASGFLPVGMVALIVPVAAPKSAAMLVVPLVLSPSPVPLG